MKIKLAPRLELIASLVPQGSFVADVGSDHAHLPIALMQRGIARGAVASDLRKGPCKRALENIALYGQEGKIAVECTDGLAGIDLYEPDCIVIAGMGAELMARILDESPIPKNGGVTLVLQPMKYAERLRVYLCRSGYMIDGEYLVRDGHIYQIIKAHYTGVPYSLSEAELWLGKREARSSPEMFGQFFDKQTARLKRIIATKEDCAEEKRLLSVLEAEIK